MSKERIVSRLLNALVLTVLVLSSMPAAGPVLSQAPADIPDAPQASPAIAAPPSPAPLPPGGAFRPAPPADPPVEPPPAAPAPQAPEVEKASDASPAAATAPQAPEAPNTCAATPSTVTFAQDLKMILGPFTWANGGNATTISSLTQARNWVPSTGPEQVSSPGTLAGNLSVAVAGTDVYTVLMKLTTNELKSIAWNGGSGWGSPVSEGLTLAGGNPVAFNRGAKYLAYFYHTGNQIKAKIQDQSGWGEWTNVLDGNGDAYGNAEADPVPLALDLYGIKVFYRTKTNTINLTEWTATTGWMTSTISLGKPSDTTGILQVNAVSRDENHISLFGVGANNSLYVKEWSTANKWDWSDTAWVKLMGPSVASPNNITIDYNKRLAVVSRHMGSVGVAVLSTSGVAWYREWDTGEYYLHPNNTPRGWLPTVGLGGSLGSIGLVATNGNEMYAYGVGSGYAYTNKFTYPSTWAGWVAHGSGWAAQNLSATAGRPNELIFVGRNTSNTMSARRWTNKDQPITQTTLVSAGQAVGNAGSQVVARAEEKTYWVSAYTQSDNKWTLQARRTDAWTTAWTLDVSDFHGTFGGQASNVAVGDVDQDGDDEILVATVKFDSTALQWALYKLYPSETSKIQRKASGTVTMGTPKGVMAAIGDLDGDGKKNELAVAARSGDSSNVKIKTYRVNSNWSTTGLTEQDPSVGAAWDCTDRHMIIAQVSSETGDKSYYAREQIVMSAWSREKARNELVTFRYSDTTTLSNTHTLWQDPGNKDSMMCGFGSTALAAADVDRDDWQEVIYTFGSTLSVISIDTAADIRGPGISVSPADYYRTLTAGDADGDGLPEILYNRAWSRNGDGGWLGIAKQMDPANNYLSWIGSRGSTAGVPLMADLYGNSAVATRRDCHTVSDLRVVSVINSSPVFGQDSNVQYSGGGMANSNESGTENSDGWKTTFGFDFSVGYKQKVEIPFIGLTIGEIRASTKNEFTGSFGQSTEREETITEENGMSFANMCFGQGAVCYSQTTYDCYTYDLAKTTSTGTYTTTSVSCLPQPAPDPLHPLQTCTSLEDWYSITMTQRAGNSWVPVGHHPPGNPNTVSVDLRWPGNYPSTNEPPVDPSRIWWVRRDRSDNLNPIAVTGSVIPGSVAQVWRYSTERKTTEKIEGSFEHNTTISAGADLASISFDASVSFGQGGEWSSGVSWGEGMEFTGNVYNYAWGNPGTYDYATVPFIYWGKAKTLSGFTYDYYEQDYFVVMTAPASSLVVAAPQSIVGLAPQAPIVTSPTHPDPATWYSNNTVTFNWSQPAGDPAKVAGYMWNIDQAPVSTPTAVQQLTTTYTYNNAADGLYYLHIQAVGDSSLLSPVVHRAFRVDTGAPQVHFIPDPSGPNGFNDWYKTPVTFTVTAADTNGSGVASVQTSDDGTTWQPYTAPLYITTTTAGRTLWARATDNLGHVSTPVSTTFKLDKNPPYTGTPDGFGLAYGRVYTDEFGNAQIAIGGTLTDTRSGRLQVEVKAGDTGEWHAVSAVGDMPIPPGNTLPVTLTTSLNWIYTPTFEIRGIYPLWARGIDVAGNYEAAWVHGVFWWEPDDVPVLDESRVSVSPHQARPRDVVAFTVAARNSGYQESQYLITDTVPAGLTVVEASITDGGLYNAATREIVWTLHAVWPAQTHYLFFNATVDSTTAPGTLENRLDLVGYWPWMVSPGIPPEKPRHYYSTSTSLTVLAGASMPASAESVPDLRLVSVLEGEIVDNQQVTLLVNASPGARSLYVKEWTWNGTLNMWSLARESGWVPFEAAAGLDVSKDDIGRYARYDWTLSQGDGVKYLGIWVADADGQISNLSEGNLIYTNLVAGGQQLAAGQRVQYRVKMPFNQLAVLTLVSLGGDADLYVWKPRAGFMPHYYSNAAPSAEGLSTDTVAFYAPEEGMYVIEVEAYTDAYYRLVTAGDISGAGLSAQAQAEALPASTHLSLVDKNRPAHPGFPSLMLTTPFSLAGIEQLPTAPVGPKVYLYYMPIICK